MFNTYFIDDGKVISSPGICIWPLSASPIQSLATAFEGPDTMTGGAV